MKTVSIAIDEHLLEQIDAAAQARRQKRSELLCEAARQWLKQQRLKALAFAGSTDDRSSLPFGAIWFMLYFAYVGRVT